VKRLKCVLERSDNFFGPLRILSTLCFPVSLKSSNFGAGAKQSAGTKKGGRQGASCRLAASHWLDHVCALISILLACHLPGCRKDAIKIADGSGQS
jgi:hypothetical protein